jgi:hypothetical protein
LINIPASEFGMNINPCCKVGCGFLEINFHLPSRILDLNKYIGLWMIVKNGKFRKDWSDND